MNYVRDALKVYYFSFEKLPLSVKSDKNKSSSKITYISIQQYCKME